MERKPIIDEDESTDPRIVAVAPVLDALKAHYGDVYLMETGRAVVCKMPTSADWERFLVEKIDENPMKKIRCLSVLARSNVVWCESCPVDGVPERKAVLAAWEALARRYPALPDDVGADLAQIAAGKEAKGTKKL